MNRLISENRFDECSLSLAVLRDARGKLLKLGGVLGLFTSDPAAWLEDQKNAGLAAAGLAAEAIEALIAERLQARKERNFARADAIRDELAAKGIELLDSKEGTSWKMK
jgi:cysteinyl-tRNA synthetase